MTWFMFVAFSGYYVLLVFLCVGWWRALKLIRRADRLTDTPFISVLIPARNEAAKIEQLLESIAQQEYNPKNFEAIVINDHSVDDTETIVKRWKAANPTVSVVVINLADDRQGKKAAIAQGVHYAQGDIVVTTDADCRVQPGWLASVAHSFDDNTQLVVGAVTLFENGTAFGNVQVVEFASLVGTGAATLGWGMPTMCNGANLAFRKSAFLEVKGYEGSEHIASGDDEFLLRKIAGRYSGGIRFNNRPEGVVEARPAASYKEFFHQRIRWAGKWRAHGVGFSALLALFIFVFHASAILLGIGVIAGVVSPLLALMLFGIKIVGEFAFLYPVLKFCKGKFYSASFLVLQFLYPFYVVCFGLAANFFGAEWKGRKI